MPYLDVTEVLSDPDLADVFEVVRRQAVVNSHGELVPVIVQRFPAVTGVCTPTGNNSLVRADAYQSQMNSLQVLTTFRIRSASKDADGIMWMPDLVRYRGDTFVVKSLNDFAQFGPGFVQAECIEIEWNDAPVPEEGPASSLDFSQASNSGNRLNGW